MQYKKHNNVKKGLLFTTAALIFATPICFAEAATANTNGAGDSFHRALPVSQQPQTRLAQGSKLLASSFLGQTPQTIRSFKFPILSADITLDDVILLQSRLTVAESQLRTLKATTPRNPQLKAQIDELISQAETQVLNLSNALKTADSLYKKYQAAAKKVDEAATRLQTAAEAEAQALEQYNTAKTNYENAQETLRLSSLNRTSTEAFLNEKLQNQSQAASAKLSALEILNTATLNLEAKTAAHTTIQGRYDQALQAKNAAQTNYDTNLIPDPTWTPPTQQVAHTRQVPHTTTRLDTQTIPNILFNPDFSQGTQGWSGVNAGWQGSSPALVNGEIVFSYQTQTVSQGLFSGPFQNATLTLSADWYNNDLNRNLPDVYSMKIEAKDINQNPVGTAIYNSTGSHDWQNKSVTLQATGPVSYITVSFTGIDSGYWYGVYGPHVKNPVLQISHGQEITETTYTTETYYTTEVIQPQTGLTVKVYNGLNSNNPQRSDTAYNLCKTTTLTNIENNWGGGDILGCGSDKVMLHYTGYITPTKNITSLRNVADDGFYMDLNGTNVINNWTLKGCGGNWNPVTLEAGKSYAIDAWFFEWGGGACSTLYYQAGSEEGVVPAAWYSNGASAPLIKDPELLHALESAQAELTSANEALTQSAQEVTTAETAKQTATTQYQSAQSNFDEATEAVTLAHTAFTQADEQTTTASTEAQAVQTTYETATTQYETAKTATVQATSVKQEAEAETEAVSTSYQNSVVKAKSITTPDDTFTQVAELQTKEPEPAQPTKEELPTEITAEAILATDLSLIDPTTMTEAQAKQLVEAALVIFETAEEGSAEYEQALDALYLAAEQDDIVLDPALAAIPGLQAATELVNFLGNAGADMSPKKREESKKIVVSAVVAAGTAIQSAAAAASTASAGTTRRTGK